LADRKGIPGREAGASLGLRKGDMEIVEMMEISEKK
jgi:hypothetical protein